MKIKLVIFALVLLSTMSYAQKIGNFLMARFSNDGKFYYAQIVDVKEDRFKVKFLHSSSIYVLKRIKAEENLINGAPIHYSNVISTTGGSYGAGSPVEYSLIHATEEMEDMEQCLGMLAIIEFADGKQYLGRGTKINELQLEFTMAHSKKKYVINFFNKTIDVSSGKYKEDEKIKLLFCTDYTPLKEEKL